MRRSAMALAALVLALAVTLTVPASASAQAKDDDCQVLDTGPIPNPIQGACDVAEAVIDKGPGAVTDVATAPIKAARDEVMQGVTQWVTKGASWLVGQAGKLIEETTTPRIESGWFNRQYDAMAALAAVFALPLLFLAVMQGVLKRDGGVVVRAVAWHLPLAFLLTGMAVVVTTLLLEITDQASAQVAGSVGNDAKEFFSDVSKSLTAISAPTGNGAVPLFAAFLGGLVAAIAAFFVWIELLLRSAAVYVCVLFLPLTFVATIWPATASWSRKLVELLVAVILSKFVIVSIMALASAGLGNSRGDEAFQGVLAGTALMVLAALSPFLLLRLVPFAEGAVSARGYRGGAGSSTLGPVASPGQVMRGVMNGNWGSGGGGGGLRAAPAGGSAAGGSFGAGSRAAGGGATAGGAAGGVAAAGVGAVATGAKAAGSRVAGGGAAAGAASGGSGSTEGASPGTDRSPSAGAAGGGGSGAPGGAAPVASPPSSGAGDGREATRPAAADMDGREGDRG